MKRSLALLSLCALVSCSNQQVAKRPLTIAEQCPQFATPVWLQLKKDLSNAQDLLNKQTFALSREQSAIWFSDKANQFIGLCILPGRNIRRATNDCGTIYVTYEKKDEEWQLLSQQMTICPS